MPLLQGALRGIIGTRGIASVKKPVCPDLANALYDQVGFVLPHARYGYPTHIEIHIFHSRIFSFYCFHKYRKSGISCRVVVASAAGKMRDLYNDVRSLREKLFQKDEGLLCSVWPMVIYVRVQVHHNRHVMLIGGTEDPSQAREMIRIVNIHIRVAEVQLQSSAQ